MSNTLISAIIPVLVAIIGSAVVYGAHTSNIEHNDENIKINAQSICELRKQTVDLRIVNAGIESKIQQQIEVTKKILLLLEKQAEKQAEKLR